MDKFLSAEVYFFVLMKVVGQDKKSPSQFITPLIISTPAKGSKEKWVEKILVRRNLRYFKTSGNSMIDAICSLTNNYDGRIVIPPDTPVLLAQDGTKLRDIQRMVAKFLK